MNKRIKKKQIKMENKRLCKRYPFLIPRHIWTDDIIWDVPKCDWRYIQPYSWTELDCMPSGWRKAFGLQMCEEIREALVEANYLDKYRITQIKSKYGTLRWYDFGAPEKVHAIVDKYEDLSAHTCELCGRPAESHDIRGWIWTICPNCEKQMEEERKRRYEKWKRSYK